MFYVFITKYDDAIKFVNWKEIEVIFIALSQQFPFSFLNGFRSDPLFLVNSKPWKSVFSKKEVHTLRCLPIKSFWSILLVCHIASPTLQIHFGGVAGERPLLSSGQLVPGFSYSPSVLYWYVMQIGLCHVWNSVFCIIHDGRLHAFGASVGYKFVQFYFVCKFANFL